MQNKDSCLKSPPLSNTFWILVAFVFAQQPVYLFPWIILMRLLPGCSRAIHWLRLFLAAENKHCLPSCPPVGWGRPEQSAYSKGAYFNRYQSMYCTDQQAGWWQGWGEGRRRGLRSQTPLPCPAGPWDILLVCLHANCWLFHFYKKLYKWGKFCFLTSFVMKRSHIFVWNKSMMLINTS